MTTALAAAKAAFRSILVHVQPEEAAAPRLETAVDLARRLDAMLLGVGAEMFQALGLTDPYGMADAAWITEVRAQIQENLQTAGGHFARMAAGIASDWVAVEDFPSNAMIAAARGADLIVSGGAPLGRHDSYRWCESAELALKSARPVLIAPPKGGSLKLDAAVVAWKDTREARRAASDAIPFLIACQDVVVLEVCERDQHAEAEYRTFSVVENLKRHGVKARPKTVVGPNASVLDEVSGEARAIGADLVVAGAYGHTRLGEWVFGGVTRDLLLGPERFVLLSH